MSGIVSVGKNCDIQFEPGINIILIKFRDWNTPNSVNKLY